MAIAAIISGRRLLNVGVLPCVISSRIFIYVILAYTDAGFFWTVNGQIYGQGTGWKKSEAQEKAAQQALAILQQEYD
jgi:hypothetical protein